VIERPGDPPVAGPRPQLTDGPRPDPARERLLTGTMLGIATGSVLVPINSTMLAVALPSVMDTFGVDAATVASLVTVYLGAVAVALPASGSLGDRFGHRRVFLVGVLAFGLASLLAASAASFAVLAGSRVLQAISGALVSTSAIALVRAEAPPDRRGAAFGLFDMLVSTSAALGPLVGGLIVGWFGWRAMFFVAAPVALVAAAAVGVLAPPRTVPVDEAATADRRPIDLPGLGLLAATLVVLLVALRGAGAGVGGTIAAFAVVPLLAAFLVVELRTRHPAVDPRLFASKPFAAAITGVFGATVVLHGCFLLVPLLVERLQHGSPETTGLVLLGISALGAIAAPYGGRISDRIGRRAPAVAGMAATAAALAVLWQVAPGASSLVLAAALSVVGFGMGLSGSPRQAAALETIAPDRVGMAAGTYYTGRYLGGVVGASLAGAVLGGAVTGAGVSLGFGLLAAVGAIVVAASFGLPGRTAAGSRARAGEGAR
jgi:EmrB/QacA subfamily drug resistance transporter